MSARQMRGLLVAVVMCLPLGGGAPVLAEPVGQSAPPATRYVGQMRLAPDHGPAGTHVTVTGTGLPANARMDLVWHSVEGAWNLEGTYDESFRGRTYKPTSSVLASVVTDDAGSFQAALDAPNGFGFDHDVTLVQDDVVRNQASFRVDMQVRISPESGPVGTPITIDVNGVGWQYLRNGWGLSFDDRYTGWISSVSTGGHATAVVPATGAPGVHVLQVKANTFTFPYLNGQQSPIGDNPVFTRTFTVTPGPPVLPAPAESQSLPPQKAEPPAGADQPLLWTDPATGPVGTQLTIHGRGLPPGQTLDLRWFSVVGNRVGGQGWDEAARSVGSATVGDDGSLALPLVAPDDLGGPHRIEVALGDTTLASGRFTITPSAFALTPASGPAGTMIAIHLKGVGWTETANIYHLVYDNAYAGYACGFNSQGDVLVNLPAAGEPGWHYIDLYPGIYKGSDISGVEDFKIPQLTIADHPGETLPAFHFAFLVTAPGS